MRTKLLLAAGLLLLSTAMVEDPEAPPPAGVQHWVECGSKRLSLWERRPPEHARSPARVVLFLHGATWSGRPNFDLSHPDFSTMVHFAEQGWDAFCLDVQGYGNSDEPEADNWCTAESAVRDVHAAVEFLGSECGAGPIHLIGWSWGSQVAGLYASRHPKQVARLVLYGSQWRPWDHPPAAPVEPFRVNSKADAKTDFIKGCFDPAMAEAYANEAIAADPSSPNGSLLDYIQNLPIIDPAAIDVPSMILLGEHEARHKMRDQLDLFEALPNPDKRFVIIPGGGHAVHLEHPRARWRSAVLDFFRAAPD